jgi:hypothetical protein
MEESVGVSFATLLEASDQCDQTDLLTRKELCPGMFLWVYVGKAADKSSYQ